MAATASHTEQAIAVIGLAGRFPGAPNVESLWKALCAGTELLHPLSDQELASKGLSREKCLETGYVPVSSALPDMAQFDAAFFGYTPREAELMDPQHRHFLEVSWEALERAGYPPGSGEGRVGVFAGAATNTYLLYHLLGNPQALEGLDAVQIDVASAGDFLPTRVAYKLNLKGPAHAILSACSTSLVAVHTACSSLLADECDLALAGGVTIHVKHGEGYQHLPGGIVSPDGHCRAFDASADGTVFSSGVGVVVLKRLEKAEEDGDLIHAVILGSAVNNDGALKVGYTAPSVEGQAAVIKDALAVAGVSADSIGYVEAHGTGTRLGDPVEVRALTRALRSKAGSGAPRRGLGSLKTNLGHLAHAAGVASLIKAVLCLEHGQLPPSLFFRAPNPEIDFSTGGFHVNHSLADWPSHPLYPRRAGVSSFGMGGTNAHVILEEPPPRPCSGPSRVDQILPISARTPSALKQQLRNQLEFLRSASGSALPDLTFTLQVGRQAMANRLAVVGSSREELVQGLEQALESDLESGHTVPERGVAFLFPGQGSQYIQMAHGLYTSEPVFRQNLNDCAEILKPELPLPLLELLFPPAEHAEMRSEQLGTTALTQPALFAVEYALARLLETWGIKPAAMLGHSLGEYVAACLAGVFSLEDALRLVAARGRLMQGLPPGAMLSVPLPESTLRSLLTAGLSVAAVNSPSLCVVSGPLQAVANLEARLGAQSIPVRRLRTSHAFHSEMMEPVVERFAEQVRQVRRQAPTLPFISNVTGTWITVEQAIDPKYWARHLRQPVLFSQGLNSLREKPQLTYLEVGPGNVLTSLARRAVQDDPRPCLTTLGHAQSGESDGRQLARCLAQLWQSGVKLDWRAYRRGEQRLRMQLPTYPFERQAYWISKATQATPATQATIPHNLQPIQEKRSQLSQWLYRPTWALSPLPRSSPLLTFGPHPGAWLILCDGGGVGTLLATQLREEGQKVVRLVGGLALDRLSEDLWSVDPARVEHYQAVLQTMAAEGQPIRAVIQLWGLDIPTQPGNGEASRPVAEHQPWPPGTPLPLAALLHQLALARALPAPADGLMPWWTITSQACAVESTDRVQPTFSPLRAPVSILPLEVPGLRANLVDLAPDLASPDRLARQIRLELGQLPRGEAVAWRGQRRWVEQLTPVPLSEVPAPLAPLAQGGCYLITASSLHGPGLVLARSLAETQSRLIILEPADFPHECDWPAHAAQGSASLRSHLECLANLESMGARLQLVRAPLEASTAFLTALETVLPEGTHLDGVIHTLLPAGTDALKPIQELHVSSLAGLETLNLELAGLGALCQKLAPDGFCLLQGSLASRSGGIAQLVPAAASLLAEQVAETLTLGPQQRIIAMGWDMWQLPESEGLLSRQPALAAQAIQPEEGLELIRRLLAQVPSGAFLVSTTDIHQRRERLLQAASAAQSTPTAREARATHARPRLATPYAAPRNELEKHLTGVLQDVLGISPIGIDDHFFELGGDSLLAVQASAALRKALKVEVTATRLYQRPSVRQLADLLGRESDGGQQQRMEKLGRRQEELSKRNQWLQRNRQR